MTDWFVGVEDINFDPIASPPLNYTSPYFRPEWARCALSGAVQASFHQDNEEGSFWRVPDDWGFNVAGAWWWSARSCHLPFSIYAYTVLEFMSAGEIPRLQIWAGPAWEGIVGGTPSPQFSSPILQIWKKDAAGNFTFLTAATGAVALGTIQKFDLSVDYSVNGHIRLYVDGVLLASYDGDVTTDGVTNITGFQLGPFSEHWWSEVVWSSADTRNITGVKTFDPQAPGNTYNWDGGGAPNVNEIVTDDGTINYSSVAGQIEQYVVPGVLENTTYLVRSVMVSARALTLPGGPQALDLGVRTGSVNAWSPPLNPPPGFANLVPQIWNTNPVTGQPWSLADLTSPPFNIGMMSAP